MSDDITFEQMDLSEKDKVLSFLKTAYPDNPRQSDAEFWDWHFVEQPGSRAGQISTWLAKSGERIAGQLATIPVELNVAGKTVQSMWILDLMVDPDFRRRGIMKKLVKIAEQHSPHLLGVNTNRQHAPALLQSLGWVIVSKIPRFHKILFPGNAVRELSQVKAVRSALNLLFAPLRPRRAEIDEHVRILPKFDHSFDAFWNEARDQWGCSISRSAATLNWQFERQPNKKFEILGYYENNNLMGYSVLFFRKANKNGLIDKAAISDICYGPQNSSHIVDTLLQASLRLAVERRAGGLVTDALDALLNERLRYFGFWPIKSGLQLMAKAPENHDFIYDRKNWFLTRGDSDISIFEHPNL